MFNKRNRNSCLRKNEKSSFVFKGKDEKLRLKRKIGSLVELHVFTWALLLFQM